jgi:hypothetical protein
VGVLRQRRLLDSHVSPASPCSTQGTGTAEWRRACRRTVRAGMGVSVGDNADAPLRGASWRSEPAPRTRSRCRFWVICPLLARDLPHLARHTAFRWRLLISRPVERHAAGGCRSRRSGGRRWVWGCELVQSTVPRRLGCGARNFLVQPGATGRDIGMSGWAFSWPRSGEGRLPAPGKRMWGSWVARGCTGILECGPCPPA